MDSASYILYLQKTIETFPVRIKKHLCQLLINKGIAQNSDQTSMENLIEESIDVRDLDLTGKIAASIQENNNARRLYEEFEYNRDYKYSVIFECNNFQELLAWGESLKDQLSDKDDESAFMSRKLNNPIGKRVNEDTLIIKFCLNYSAVDPLIVNELKLKYTVLIVLHVRSKIVEFRFDSIQRFFISDKQRLTIYSDLVSELREFIFSTLGIKLLSMDLSFMRTASQQEIDGAHPLGDNRKLPNGGNVQLDVGKNENFTIPIIGELKELLAQYKKELDEIPSLQQAFDQFIYENDELADYTWVGVMWENEIKAHRISARFTFDYQGKDYCLIQHYHNSVLIGMERMDRVTEYIVKHRNDFAATDK